VEIKTGKLNIKEVRVEVLRKVEAALKI